MFRFESLCQLLTGNLRAFVNCLRGTSCTVPKSLAALAACDVFCATAVSLKSPQFDQNVYPPSSPLLPHRESGQCGVPVQGRCQHMGVGGPGSTASAAAAQT